MLAVAALAASRDRWLIVRGWRSFNCGKYLRKVRGRRLEEIGGARPKARATPPPLRSPRYRSRDSTDAVDWFACARAARPACDRMLNRVMFADSSATLASRIRLSAAWVLTVCDCASEIA